MSILKFGMIGMSEGNGHPYSWSAILNGFNPSYMKDCPFTSIPKYLNQHSFPENCCKEAKVTHIWCQDKSIANHVALSANIPHIVDYYQDMLGFVDAILLARDDAENHYQHAEIFLKAGLPIYIDKLLAYKMQDAMNIFELEQYPGQIFTGSALAFSPEFALEIDKLGSLIHIDACVMNGFKKYGIHVLDPIFRLIGCKEKLIQIKRLAKNKKDMVLLTFESGLTIFLTALHHAHSPISIRIFGENGYQVLSHDNTYQAFKNALSTFTKVVQTKQNTQSKEMVLQMVKIVEEFLNAK